MSNKIKNDQGQRMTRTRASLHAARTPKGDTRPPREVVDGGEQRRKRTLIVTHPDYATAAAAAVEIIRGAVANKETLPALQVRKNRNGFGVYKREYVK